MQKNRKCILSALLGLLLCLTCLPGISASGTGSSGTLYEEYIYYSVTSAKEVRIESARASITEAEIPAEIEGYPVTEIADYAFKDCIRLRSATIPDSVRKIGAFAFKDCKNLTELTIPDTVEKIGWGIAQGTPWLEQQEAEFVTAGKGILLAYRGTAAQVTVPDGVTAIGGYAFSSCDGVETVQLPESVTVIDAFAFDQCRNLKQIALPSALKSIGQYAFHWCTSLETISMPDSVTEVGNHAFSYCKSLQSVRFSENLKQISNMMLSGCTSLTELMLPEQVEILSNYAFQDCTSLTEVTIPESVTEIGIGVFAGCGKLQQLTILNAYCRIYDSEETISEGTVVCGNLQSTAQVYAEKYARRFLTLEWIRGDFDGDGSLSATDAWQILVQYAISSAGGELSLTQRQEYVCDYNESGSIDLDDAYQVLLVYSEACTGKV